MGQDGEGCRGGAIEDLEIGTLKGIGFVVGKQGVCASGARAQKWTLDGTYGVEPGSHVSVLA